MAPGPINQAQPDGTPITPVHPDDVDGDSIPTILRLRSPDGSLFTAQISNAGAWVIAEV